MSQLTVEDFAEVVTISHESLLEQLHEAGLSQLKPTDVITDYDKSVLLTHLRQKHGKGSFPDKKG